MAPATIIPDVVSQNGSESVVDASSRKRKSVSEESPAEPKAKKGSTYDAIPGPLGLASASLEGKVALVTGAGML